VGRIGDKGEGSGKGEEMIQILYAHINKRKKRIKPCNILDS
jgi:hypothetical protein